MLFSFAHLEQIRNARNTSLKESESNMTSSAYSRTGVLSMLSTEAHSWIASVSMYVYVKQSRACGFSFRHSAIVFHSRSSFVTFCEHLEFLDNLRDHIC